MDHEQPARAESFTLRGAAESDVPALEQLIAASVMVLQAPHYSREQREQALGPVFGVDRQLIRDRTYFVVETNGIIVACGGWSHRKAMFGGDRHRPGEDGSINPAHEPARIRAFFVHPDWTRRGLGRLILHACETAIRCRGFHAAELVGTLTGEALYAACGYSVVERFETPLRDGLMLPVIRMRKEF